MPKLIGDRSSRAVEAFKKPGEYAISRNLYLKIAGGSRSWVVRYVGTDGRRHKHGLGSCDLVTIDQAREIAIDIRRGLKKGADPIVDKVVTAHKIAPKFREAVDQYAAIHGSTWKNGVRPWIGPLRDHVFPVFGDVPVDRIDVSLVLAALGPIWSSKTVTAKTTRTKIEAVLGFAQARGWRPEGSNPAVYGARLKAELPAPAKLHQVKHLDALDYRQVGAFIADLRRHDGGAAAAVEFGILTGARAKEIALAAWSEMDLEARTWALPGARAKNGKTHIKPLSEPALTILARMAKIRVGNFVFCSHRFPDRPVNSVSLLQMVKLINPKVTMHGFRSSFSTWAGEGTAFPHDVVDRCLAHSGGDPVEMSYRRGAEVEKRRQVMDAWARYCAEPAVESQNVIAIRG
jgi:integrase